MKTPFRVAVTGTNRGIGQAICSLIAAKPPLHQNQTLKLFAASRQGNDIGLKSVDVVYPKLDISNSDSIQAFAKDVTRDGKVDVLINNAGVNLDDQYGPVNAKRTLDVNYRGTLETCKTFIPLLAPEGRIVNLSSVASSLRPYTQSIQDRFRDPNMTLEDLESLAQDYEKSVHDNTEKESGFVGTGRSYSFSKSCINAFTAILARENAGLIINACCPGWINTDMGVMISKMKPPKTPEQGALVPYHVAFEDIGGVTGKYWANDNIRSKESGKVQEW